MKKNTKNEKGITLIALVVTIIVLIILAGISISLVLGDNGIVTKAKEAQVKTEKAQIIENAQTDILGQQAENKGANITKEQLAEILNTYFKPTAETSIPDEISSEVGHDIELTTIDEKYKINLSQIYTCSFEAEQAKWTYNHDTQTVTNGALTLNVGDTITGYDPTNGVAETEKSVTSYKTETGADSNQIFTLKTKNDYSWRVFGASDGGDLLITTSEPIWTTSPGSPYQLKGYVSYGNAINELTKTCELYGKGTLAQSARSITIDDINKITGYIPANSNEIYMYNASNVTVPDKVNNMLFVGMYWAASVFYDSSWYYIFMQNNGNVVPASVAQGNTADTSGAVSGIRPVVVLKSTVIVEPANDGWSIS